MRLRRLFVSLFLALGQFYGWLAVILRWLAKRLEQTAVTGATPEPAETNSLEPAQQPPAHWLAHVRREPPADWLEKVRQGAPQLLDPQLRPSRPSAPPPPPAARQTGHRPPAAVERSRARPLKQVSFRPPDPAATQPDKQSSSVTPLSAASSSAKTTFAGPPGSAPDPAEAADDGPPLPEGRPFPQAAFAESDNQSEPAPAAAAPEPERNRGEPAESVEAAIPAAPEIKPPLETAAPPLKQPHHRTLLAADFPRPAAPGNEPDESEWEEKPVPPVPPTRRVLTSQPAPPLPAPLRRSPRPLGEREQQPVNPLVTPVLEERGAPAASEDPSRPPEKMRAADRFTAPPSPSDPQPETPDVGPAVRPDYWPPLAETAAPSHKAGQSPATIPPEGRQPLAGKPITADLWPALPDTFLDDWSEWEDDFYIEQQERRQRLDFEQRGPEWNE